MTDAAKPLSPEELSDLINKLDSVMAEAAKLRAQVSRQLAEYRDAQQSVTSREPRRKRRRSSR